MQTIRYVGKSDVRRVTSAQWTSVGITSPDTQWDKSNSYTASIDDTAAAFCLAQGDFVAGNSNTKFGNIFNRKYVDVPQGFGDVNWDAKKLLAGSQNVYADWYSDSIGSRGTGVTPDTPQNRYNLSVAGLVQQAVQTKYGNGGSGFLSHEYTTATGTWTQEGHLFGSGGVRATATATLNFPNCVGTSHQIFHGNAGITGSFRYRVDGGGYTTVTPPTGFSLEPGGATISTSAGTHSIDVEWVSGQVLIYGIQSKNATGVVFNRCGLSGKAASHYSINPMLRQRIIGTTNASTAITCGTPGWFTKDMEGMFLYGPNIAIGTKIITVTSAVAATVDKNALATGNQQVDVCLTDPLGAQAVASTVEPFLANGLNRADLLIIQLGANDPSNALWSPESMRNGIGKILKPYMQGNADNWAPDLLFIIEHQANWFDTLYKFNEMAASIGQMAKSHNAALIDIWALGKRSFKYWNDLGYFADNIHPSNTGHSQYAQPIIDLLTQ